MRGKIGDKSGKFYSEHIFQGVPYFGVGISVSGGGLNYYAGSSTVAGSLAWLEQVAAVRYNNSNILSSFSANNGDVIGMAVDLDNGKIYWRLNGAWGSSQNPANNDGLNYETRLGSGNRIFPIITLGFYSGTTRYGDSNFGQDDFIYAAPSGYTGWYE